MAIFILENGKKYEIGDITHRVSEKIDSLFFKLNDHFYLRNINDNCIKYKVVEKSQDDLIFWLEEVKD